MDRRAAARLFLSMLLAGATVPAWPSDECDVPAESWQPRGAVRALAQRNGWQVDTLKIDDGCYEIKGRDAEGRRFKTKVDPATLRVVTVKREHGKRDRDRDREREREGRRDPAPPASAALSGTTAPGTRPMHPPAFLRP